MIKKIIVLGILVCTPLITFAAFTETTNIIGSLGDIVSDLTLIAAGVALLAFFWGLARFIFALNKGDSETISNGRNFMVWAIIALFIMVSVWGIIRYMRTELNLNGSSTEIIPTLR